MIPAQESDNVRSRTVLVVGALLAICSILCILGAWWLGAHRHTEEGREPYSGTARDDARPASSQIQTTLYPRDPSFREEHSLPNDLDRYGWVDRERGTVHIPLSRATELYLARKSTVAKP